MLSRIDEAIISLEIANLNDQLNPEQKEILQKGKRAVIGEIREYYDGKYQKTETGWKYIKGSDPRMKNKTKTEDKKEERSGEKESPKTSDEIRSQISEAPIGSIASGGGYSPWVKIDKNSWENTKTKYLAHNDSIFDRIGTFSDFNIKEGEKKEDKSVEELMEEEYKKDVSEAKDSMYYLLKKFYKEKPAMSSDRRHIEVAKVIAKKYKIKYQDLLKQYTPSRNINGEKYWDKNGEIVN